MAGNLTEQEIWDKVFHPTGPAIVVGTGVTGQGAPLTVQEVLNAVHDPNNHWLRTK